MNGDSWNDKKTGTIWPESVTVVVLTIALTATKKTLHKIFLNLKLKVVKFWIKSSFYFKKI